MASNVSKIHLNGERSGHVEKYINNLSAWQFFKVLYGNSMFKMMAVNLLMLVFIVPCVLFFFRYNTNIAVVSDSLPLGGALGIGLFPVLDLGAYVTGVISKAREELYVWLVPSIAVLGIAFSGSFAVIRDSFWTGKMKVFKTFFIGVYNTALYSILGLGVLAGGVYGTYKLGMYLSTFWPQWLVITLVVVIGLVLLMYTLYLFVLLGVASVHKQSVGANLSDAWYLLWMNFVPNFFRLIIALLPLILMMLMSGLLMTLILSFYVLFGAFYTAYVWMHHMMKTFALFHPVERKRIK